jgi:hypothetical protein
MRIKTVASRVGNAILDLADDMHNSAVRSEIDQIDKEQAALREQLTRLEEERSNKVSQLTR